MDLNLLNKNLVKEKLLKEIIYFEELESTNNYAKQNETNTDTLVLTSYQSKGTGRFGRPWNSIPGKNLTFSLVKTFNISIDEVHLVNFYSSYVLCKTLNSFFEKGDSLAFELKWPNDILLNRKKVAGFLLDVKDLKSSLKKFIIGVGLNVNQNELPPGLVSKATTLFSETKKITSIEELLTKFIEDFYGSITLLNKKNELMDRWIKNSNIIGKNISFKKVDDDMEKRGTVMDIDCDGGLLIQFSGSKPSKFYSGEITIIYK